MKNFFKLLFVGLFALFSINVQAQAPVGPKITFAAVGQALRTPTANPTDTLTNTTGRTQFAIVQGSNSSVTFQSLYTRVSGTAAGTITLQGSIDGVNWSGALGSAYTITDVASQVATFTVTPSTFQFYRIVVAPTGTQSSRRYTKVLVRRQ